MQGNTETKFTLGQRAWFRELGMWVVIVDASIHNLYDAPYIRYEVESEKGAVRLGALESDLVSESEHTEGVPT